MSKVQRESEKSPISMTISADGWVTTIALSNIDGGFFSEWWTSRIGQEGEIEMFSTLQIPLAVKGQSKAKACVEEMHSSYLNLIRKQESFLGARCLSLPSKEHRGHIARAHLEAHLQRAFSFHSDLPLTMQTYFQSEFCKTIGISSPAMLIGELLRISPKTVNQRIFEAKKSISHITKNRFSSQIEGHNAQKNQ